MRPRRGLLVRVGADQSEAGGHWNGPVDSSEWCFAYVPIPETKAVRPGMSKPYSLVTAALRRYTLNLPTHLARLHMHLDPDFEHLTYGDQGQRAKQIQAKLLPGDLLVFYAGLRDVATDALVYGIIGVYVISSILPVARVPQRLWTRNAHTRRAPASVSNDIVVWRQPGLSGRLTRCIPIGEFSRRAYRVNERLLRDWGGVSSHDGYLQRSARLPELLNAERFYGWFLRQNPRFLTRNN